MSQSTKLSENIHPVLRLVKPSHRDKVNLPLVEAILKMRFEGYTFNEISKRLYVEKGINRAPQRIQTIFLRYGSVMKEVANL